ncbi:MAG: cyclodeaminase/cyclohydrolase family protein [Lachnospiraceae bacterium]|nr:cyclodeaminase/cyclohydrolase family protein [Lachnospiraceae bacterium]
MEQWKDYLEALASKAPVPGGGGASAVCAALGAALGEMVGNLTTGKKKYAEWETGVCEALGRLETLRARFLELSEEDARVFEPLSKAYGIRAETEAEKQAKAVYMEACLLEAAKVPLALMECCRKAMTELEFLALHGSRLAVSDAGVGIQFLRSALLGAVMNVYINTKLMKNRETAAELNEHAQRLAAEGAQTADRIYEIVLKAVKE